MQELTILTELLKSHVSSSACDQETGSCEFLDCRTCTARYLAHSILDAGFVQMPYKVGDTLYYIDARTGNIETDTIKFITITKTGSKPILEQHNIKFWKYYTFGENVFWTEQEAIEAKAKIGGVI